MNASTTTSNDTHLKDDMVLDRTCYCLYIAGWVDECVMRCTLRKPCGRLSVSGKLCTTIILTLLAIQFLYFYNSNRGVYSL